MDNSTKTTAQRFSDLMSTIRPESVLSLVDSENDRHEHIMKEARERVMLESRNGLCKLFEVTYSEIRNDDECGGSVKVQFPNGWTKYSAERFCIQFLKLDLSEYDGGPGRMFRQCSTWVSGETGVVTVAIRCGLDI